MSAVPVAAILLRRGEAGWPERLDHLGAKPAELWVRGTLPPRGAPAVAVVGSRRPTPGGLMTARDIGEHLAAAGITVVSGMARGVDGAAHRGAIEAGGRTVAVLGCGIDLCYPREHRELRERICERGCVLSEDGGEAPPETWRFPRRNRIIAALAEAVIVVEASTRSGALSTARWAADLGREILAVPGSIRNATSAGANLLLRDGAWPYLDLTDLFQAVPELARNVAEAPPSRAVAAGAATAPDPGEVRPDPLMQLVLDRLQGDPVHPDALAATLRVAPAELATALTTLELRGAITEVSGGRVARTF